MEIKKVVDANTHECFTVGKSIPDGKEIIESIHIIQQFQGKGYYNDLTLRTAMIKTKNTLIEKFLSPGITIYRDISGESELTIDEILNL